MTDRIRLFAGECTAEYEGDSDRTVYGRVVTLIKPDNTVLVHDTDGYSPTAWLTRPGSLDIDHSGEPTITAVDGDQRLTVRFRGIEGHVAYPVSAAGVPVGPASAESSPSTFVRSRGSVVDRTSGDRYALPTDGVVLDLRCEACGLPVVRSESADGEQRCLDLECKETR